jgi:hypothetical protein
MAAGQSNYLEVAIEQPPSPSLDLHGTAKRLTQPQLTESNLPTRTVLLGVDQKHPVSSAFIQVGRQAQY